MWACRFALSEIEPSPYVKAVVDEPDSAVDWLICKIWTGDTRYFGTDKIKKEYELNISNRVKAKFFVVPK